MSLGEKACALTDNLFGFEVILDKTLVEKVWVFPKHRFIEYDSEDEWWCRKYGFGHEEIIPMKTIYKVQDKLLIHPHIFNWIKNANS